MSANDSYSSARNQLLPHQRSFVEHYFSDTDSKTHLLIAPSGSGTTTTIIELLRQLLSEGKDKRILYIAEYKGAISAVRHMLHERDLNPIQVDRYKYRELQESTDLSASPWHSPGIYLCLMQFAIQSDIYDELTSSPWDLLIYDSPSRDSSISSELLCRLLESVQLRSAIILARTPNAQTLPALPADISVTEWKLQDLLDWSMKPLWSPCKVELENVTYVPSSQEITIQNLVTEISELAQDAKVSTYDPYSGEIWLRSLYSRVQDERNRIAHSRKGERFFGENLKKIHELLQRIELAFELIEDQKVDSKLEALTSLLAYRQSDWQRVVITTPFKNTVQYLTSSLESEFENVAMLSTSVGLNERNQAIHQFRDAGGILIASEAILLGTDLAQTDILIPYEPPSTAQKAAVLLSRFIRIGRTKPITIMVLQEDSIRPEEEGLNSVVIQEALDDLGATIVLP